MEKRNNRIHQIDEKGRVAIPISLRKEMRYGEKLVLTKGIENCIFVFREEEWKKFEERIKNIELWDENKRKAIRYIFGEAEEAEIDAQGRILLPGNLMKHANLKSSCMFIKMPRWFEIWDPETYRENHKVEEIDFRDLPL